MTITKSDNPECPAWAGGAHVYLSAQHFMDQVQRMVERNEVVLDDTMVLTSWEYRTLVERALGLKPEEEGLSAEAFLSKREAVIESEEALGDFPKSSEEGTHVESRGCCSPRTSLLFVELDPAHPALQEKFIDRDLAAFLTSPASVKELELSFDGTKEELWLSLWQHIIDENDWIEMQDGHPYCRLCDKLAWATSASELPHLVESQQCRERAGVFLNGLLDAVDGVRKESEEA